MATEWSDIYQLFFDEIQKDPDFFMYNNVDPTEALEIATSRAKGYLIESVSELILSCTPDIDFTDFNATTESFTPTLTFTEKDILAKLMFKKFLDKDMVLLKALSNSLSPKDMNVFSPANERRTFTDMLKILENKNTKMIKSYASRDRLTNKLKQINYASYNEV